MIIDIQNLGEYLNISHFNSEGDLDFLRLEIPEEQRFTWEKCSSGDRARDKIWTSWDGSPVKKVFGKKYDKYRVQQIINDADPEKTKILWEYQKPKKYYVDIEVEITDNAVDSLDTENAPNRVLSIGIATDNHRLILLGLDPLDDDQILGIEKRVNEHLSSMGDKWTVRYMQFQTEFDMLYTFMAKLSKKMGLITGWNWFGYDWPYLINRCKKLNINPAIISPSMVLKGNRSIPQHLLMVDYLEIYKKFDRVIKIKENNKLDYVGEQATGIKKIQYNGTLRDLYQSSFSEFIAYNGIDCALLYYIDKNIATMDTFFKMAMVTGSEIDRTLSPVWTTELMMMRIFSSRKKVFVDERKETIHEKFEGAFVKIPIVGLHEWVACFDFASLYPNTMVQWCISPENYKGKNLINPKEEWIKSASGAFFGPISEEPIIRSLILDLYARRKQKKSQMLKIKMEISELEEKLKELV
jgi:DNA polymerase elongation subunit (family B)